MSGGYFDYAFSVVNNDFLDKLNLILNENSTSIERPDVDQFLKTLKPETIQLLKQLRDNIEIASQEMHHIEWLFSGDYGEETFLNRIAETHIKRLET